MNAKDNSPHRDTVPTGKNHIQCRIEKEHLDATAIRSQLFEEIMEKRIYRAGNGLALPYRLYVPYEYDESKEYPVLLFLHGAGERGNNNVAQLTHLVADWFVLDDCPATEAIIVVPQCPEGRRWVETNWATPIYSTEAVPESPQLEAVMELLSKLGDEFSTDTDRYYVSGISMGGFGTWDLISRHTDTFAGAVPICGGADPSCAEALVNFPIYTVHDAGDTTVPPTGTRQMVEAIQEAGGKAIRYTETQGYGHGSWTWAGQQKEVWAWLFDQNLADR